MNSTISALTWARTPLFTSNLNSLLLSNRVTWDNREVVSKDAKSIFQRRFHGSRRCRILRSLMLRRAVCPSQLTKLGTLGSDDGDGDGDGNMNVKKAIDLISKTTYLHVHQAFPFGHFSALLRRENVQIPRFMENGQKVSELESLASVFGPVHKYPDIFETANFSLRIQKFPRPHVAYSNQICTLSEFTLS